MCNGLDPDFCSNKFGVTCPELLKLGKGLVKGVKYLNDQGAFDGIKERWNERKERNAAPASNPQNNQQASAPGPSFQHPLNQGMPIQGMLTANPPQGMPQPGFPQQQVYLQNPQQAWPDPQSLQYPLDLGNPQGYSSHGTFPAGDAGFFNGGGATDFPNRGNGGHGGQRGNGGHGGYRGNGNHGRH